MTLERKAELNSFLADPDLCIKCFIGRRALAPDELRELLLPEERLAKAERLNYSAWSLLVEIADSGIFEEALDACHAEITECGPLLQYERYQRRKKIAEDDAAKYKALINKTKAAIER